MFSMKYNSRFVQLLRLYQIKPIIYISKFFYLYILSQYKIIQDILLHPRIQNTQSESHWEIVELDTLFM